MFLPLLLGMTCHFLTGSFTCDSEAVSQELIRQKNGIAKILTKELGTLENITELESHFHNAFDVFLESNTVPQSDQAIHHDENEYSYKPTDFEVLHCSWCVSSNDVFLWTANIQRPKIPYGTSCESLQDLEAEAASGNSSWYAVGYSTRTLGCYNRIHLGLFHLNQTDIPEHLTEVYGAGYNLLDEVNWSLSWPMQTEVEVMPLTGQQPGSASQENSV